MTDILFDPAQFHNIEPQRVIYQVRKDITACGIDHRKDIVFGFKLVPYLIEHHDFVAEDIGELGAESAIRIPEGVEHGDLLQAFCIPRGYAGWGESSDDQYYENEFRLLPIALPEEFAVRSRETGAWMFCRKTIEYRSHAEGVIINGAQLIKVDALDQVFLQTPGASLGTFEAEPCTDAELIKDIPIPRWSLNSYNAAMEQMESAYQSRKIKPLSE